MLFVGDVHGKLEYLPNGRRFVQVGDMGVGFVNVPENPRMRFIRGNHDNPALCQTHPNFIGDWKLVNRVLFIGGAGSIDRAWRTEDVDWWRDEELNKAQMDAVLDIDPWGVDAVVAHDAPRAVYDQILDGKPAYDRFVTPKFLDAVLERFEPSIWVCGHFHVDKRFKHGRTRFNVLAECQAREIDIDCGELWR